MWGADKTVMVSRDDAVVGRDTPLVVSDRHAVLGTPLKGPWPEGYEVLYVGMGCFWGAERIFWRIPGVHSTAVGYLGGWTTHPTYAEVCSALTGHAEVAQVVFDPAVVSIQTLLAAFWDNHDPTTPNRQGNDVGTQYRSCIFATTPEQLTLAEQSRDRYQQQLAASGFGTISTQIDLVDNAGDGTFYYAEDYHQAYLHKNPGGYCNHGFCQVAYSEDAAATPSL